MRIIIIINQDIVINIIMEDDNGKEIRIERDFLKTRDGVRIFNNITGEEITQTYPYDHVTKQYLPLGYGSVNSVVYNNTVNFKQMASRSDDDLAKEVNNRLVDLVTDNSDDISVKGFGLFKEQERSSWNIWQK